MRSAQRSRRSSSSLSLHAAATAAAVPAPRRPRHCGLALPDRRAALLCAIDTRAHGPQAAPVVHVNVTAGARGPGPRRRHGHARYFFEHVTPGGSTLGDRVHATGYIARRARLGARRGDRLGPAAARHARQPHARLDREPGRTARSSSTATSATSAWASTAGLTDGSAGLGATAVSGLRLPHVVAYAAAMALGDDVRAHGAHIAARRALGAHRPRRARRARARRPVRSSTPSATTSRARRPTSPTTS